MPKPIGNSGRYMPGLDGLRAIAVLAVIAYHLNLKAVPGGLLGVSMFFVLSGYLITDILLKQLGQKKTIDLKTFIVRRARRLLPAMFLMIALVSLWLLISDSERLLSLKGDIGSALLYISNWWLIFHEVSYFESFGPASPFGHLWSLAVEEQFYLVWPLVLIAVIRFVPKRGMLALWTLAAAAISAGAMALLYQPGMDPSRVYYGTDTRAFALLIGAALAVVWPSWKLSASISVRGRLLLDTVGTAGLVLILFMIGQTGEYDASLYRGGMVLLAIATAAVVAAMAHPASRLAQIIGSKALAWVGVRSYGIYLYHYPIIVLTTPAAESGELHPVRALLQVVLTFILAELSWRFVEEPIRHGALGKLFALLKKQASLLHLPQLRKSSTYFAGIVLIVSCVSCTSSVDLQSANGNGSAAGTPAPGLSHEASAKPTAIDASLVGMPAKPVTSALETTPPKQEPKPTPENPAVSAGNSTEKPDNGMNGGSKHPDKDNGKAAVGENVTDTTVKETAGSDSATPSPDIKPETTDHPNRITAIGDSVLLDAGPFLENRLPGIQIDGKVGRQFSEAAAIIEELKTSGKLGETVIIELGTNGAFTAKQMNALLEAIGEDREIVMVNTRVPRKWQDTVNKMLAETAESHNHVSVVDWYSASKGNEDFFSKDGVHLKKHGAEFYADMLVDALAFSE